MTQALRHFCRHCRGKLPAPTANLREAFDSPGCHRSFYRHRCLVCEREMPRLREDQKTCYRAECKAAWRKKLISSHFLGANSASGGGVVPAPSISPSNRALFLAIKTPEHGHGGYAPLALLSRPTNTTTPSSRTAPAVNGRVVNLNASKLRTALP